MRVKVGVENRKIEHFESHHFLQGRYKYMTFGQAPYDNMPVTNCRICGIHFEPFSDGFYCQCGTFFHFDCAQRYPTACPYCNVPNTQGRYKVMIGATGDKLRGGGVLVGRKKKKPLICVPAKPKAEAEPKPEGKALCPTCSKEMKLIEKYQRYYYSII